MKPAEALKLLDEYIVHARALTEHITAIREALAQPEHKAQLLFEVDGEMLTASQMMGVELFNFQQATGCDTADEFLAQPEQEPVAWLWELTGEVTTDPDRADGMWKPLYTTPPHRTWVGLTDEDRLDAKIKGCSLDDYIEIVEAKLKEKNTWQQ